MARLVDERRHDFTIEEAFTPGETRTIDWTIQEKVGGVIYIDAEDFDDYADWEFFVFKDLRDGGGSQAERTTAAIFALTVGDGVSVGTAPLVSVTMTAEKTALVEPGLQRGYEFWVRKGGGWTRIRYGYIPFVD